ncbi:L-iditol 2-dehydrogenase [Haloactinopolyspora alba]|uniref:L-iditol 2-dehydrogenase n=1 Tax=Haloactinopolyspora alba TaxID=648780 RepID=A0A2P8EF22_9ACTN|nr:alcohol dehydrogenase catalytic domain-containing protein [Haloactinopolyspora alba]PSL08057.1 L-iditol 2-dehydrogenase [Haloactinopolyspora alba]
MTAVSVNADPVGQGTMSAAVFHGPGDVRLEQVPVPDIGRDEVLVRVAANTICGTDLRILRGEKTRGVRRPSVLGHEFAGTVAAAGADAGGFAEGDPVAMAPVVPCLRCVHCRNDRENVCADRRAMGYEFDGAIAEYVRIPAAAIAAGNLFHVDADLPLEQLALAEPLACCVNGFGRSAVRPGDTVVVMGAGPIGLLHTQLAVNAGASRVVVSDLSPSRLRVAGELGATTTVDVSERDLLDVVHQQTGGVGADASLVCIGIPSLVDEAVRLTRKGGSVNIFAGLAGEGVSQVSANEIHYRELVVTGTSAMRRRDYEMALRLIETGAVDVGRLLTHRVPLSDAAEAFELAGSGDGLKVAIVP